MRVQVLTRASVRLLATVNLPTESRTAFEYIVGPLADSFHHVFEQK